jgi:hypothetical protein
LATSLAKPCIRLIGLKSWTFSAPSFLGIRVISAPLTAPNPRQSKWDIEWKAIIMSVLMISQQAVKKRAEKPSGSGHLSLGILLRAVHNSSSEKAPSICWGSKVGSPRYSKSRENILSNADPIRPS